MNILDFCGVGDIREYLNSPFFVDGNICCSNGHILAWKDEGEVGSDKAPDGLKGTVRGIMDINHSKFKPYSFEMPEIEMCKCSICQGTGKCTLTKCGECEGRGLVEFDNYYNDYEFECKSCDGNGAYHSTGGDICVDCHGSGKVQETTYLVTEVCGVLIQAKYAKMIHGEGLKCFKQGDMLYFKKDGLTGVIYGCRE